jgi:diaminopimelate decarboxylase
LPLNGLHFHQGSNFRDPAPLVLATQIAVDLAREVGLGPGWHFCPGGGWSVAYHEDELPQPEIEAYVRLVAETVIEACKIAGLPLPVLHLEPGRSLIARAGVAVYRIGIVKRRSDHTWLLVDGGMADNPRHALYGSRYSCLPATGLNRKIEERVSVAGPFCESGDVLIEDLPMPKMKEGELIAIPAGGAYQLSMASNYNGARRPAVIWLEHGRAQLIVRRETIEDLSLRDISLA